MAPWPTPWIRHWLKVSWCTHCFVWSRGALTVGVSSQNRGSVIGNIMGFKNITVCNANTNLPEAAQFHNSIFGPPNAHPLHSAARGWCPLRPFPPPLSRNSSIKVSSIPHHYLWLHFTIVHLNFKKIGEGYSLIFAPYAWAPWSAPITLWRDSPDSFIRHALNRLGLLLFSHMEHLMLSSL